MPADSKTGRCLSGQVVTWVLVSAGAIPPRDYTPADALQLFQDAGLAVAQQLAPLLLNRTTSSSSNTPPGTNFYGFIGTGNLLHAQSYAPHVSLRWPAGHQATARMCQLVVVDSIIEQRYLKKS